MDSLTIREEQIINIAVERALLMLPEVVESLITQKAFNRKAAVKFFQDNKDFTGNMKFVQDVIEKTELANPGLTYEEILQKATPEIKKGLMAFKTLDFKTVTKPIDLTFKGDHGAL